MAETLGPYTLDKRIGSGGMADVFLARGPMGVCVVKRPHPHLCANPDFLRMFLDEASLLAQLHHPGIAQIYDLGHVDNVYFLSMEYVPGFDLMTISIEHERHGELMPPELCARLAADAAGALHYAHTAVGRNGQPLNIIHRDVSPHNVLLSTSGVVKVIDFGVARADSATHRTQAGLVKGKYPYMSPEQITGQAIDHRVDVYALGLVLYELLTNARAIAGDSEVQQIDNARSARIRPVEQLRPNVPEGLKQILSRALQPQAADRYPTAEALKQDLEAWLASERQVVGQEDLLRLFRVVAADLQQMAPVGVVDLKAMHLTEREQPLPAVMFADGLPPGLAVDPTMGAANTEPSMKSLSPQAGAPIPLTPGQRVGAPLAVPDLDSLRSTLPASSPGGPAAASPADLASLRTTEPASSPGGPAPALPEDDASLRTTLPSSSPGGPAPARPKRSRAWLVVALLAVAVLVVVGAVAARARLVGQGPEQTVDAGAPVAVPQPPVAAQQGAVDAGPAVVEPPVAEDAGPPVDPRIASVPVFSVVEADVYVNGKRYGRTPVELELSPGTYVVSVVNRDEFLRWSKKLTVKPGERRVLSVEPGKGTLSVRLTPFGTIKIDGRSVTTTPVSFKEVPVYEGTHELEFRLEDAGKSKTTKTKVTVHAGETKPVEYRFELPL